MDSKYLLLDLPVREGKDMGEGRVIYSFKKDEHVKLLLNNLAEMQANEGLLTDVNVRTTSKDYKEPFYSMLLAAFSPVIRQSLTGEHFDCTAGVLTMKDLTADVLKAFRNFLYKAEFPSDEELVNPLKAFAKRYDIDSLKKLCRKDKDQRSSDQEMLVWSSHHRKGVLSELHEMFQRKELATTLLEDGEGNTQFAVHGPLVAAASPVLRQILSNDLFSQNGAKYRLKEIPSNILGDLIEYIYTGEVTLEGENVVGLLNAASSYEIPALGVACCDWLSLQLDSHNAVGILWLARKANSKYTKALEEEAKTFTITNFANVCEEAEFDELEYEDLKEIIQHDDLCVNCEEDVFYAVAKWVEADEDGRSPYMEDLLQCVRLENTSLEFLSILQEDPRIVRSAHCLQIIQNAQRKLVQARVKQEPTDRGSFDSLEQDLFQSGDTPGFVPQHYDTEEDIKRKLLEEFLQSTVTSRPELDDVSPRRGQRKNGKPDMRFKENRRSLGLQKKDGSPDMRFKINKEEVSKLSSQRKVTAPKSQKGAIDDLGGRPLKKDGTPDRRFKVNKEAVAPPSSQKSSPRSGPVKKDGTPDMRFAVNKTPTGGKSSPAAKIPSSGSVAFPVKRDGTPDMRFAINKQSSTLVVSPQTSSPVPQSSYTRGPVKKDGTPDMRYAVNKQSASPSPSSDYGGSSLLQLSSYSSPSGPVKRDGTPDMRYAVNKSSYGSPMSSGYSSGGSSYSSRSSSSGSVSGSSSCGPLKRDGTPDMRYAANRSSYGSPVSSGYSSGVASYSSRSSSSGGAFRSSSCGPLKSNGTPDMRFKANRR
ncbi:uncharacterized protein LOC144628655 [Oculina patagonica]